MPPLPHVAKVLKVEWLFSLSEVVPALSRQYWHYSGSTPSAADALTFADNALAGFTADPLELLSANHVFTGVSVVDLSSDTGAEAISPTTVVGTRTGAGLPQDTAVVVAYEIARRYRGGHPRGYWPFGVESDINDDRTWGADFLSAVTSDLASMQTAVAGGGWSGAGTLTQVNVSYFHGFTVVTDPVTGRARNVPTTRATPLQDNVSAYVARSKFGVQRRRLG